MYLTEKFVHMNSTLSYNTSAFVKQVQETGCD